MKLKEEVGKILNYIYNCKIEENRIPKINELLEKSNLKPHKLQMVLDYCIENNYLKIIKFLESDKSGMRSQMITKILSNGIDLCSNKKEFKKNFGFGVNLGIVNFNWGVSEQ